MMTSATEVLRHMLDERGVEWTDSSDENVLHTTWNDMNCWFNEFPDGWTAWGMAKRGTPEQAIEATLGSGTCKVESMHGYTDTHTHTSWFVELSCHTLDAWEDSIPPSYCPICGARVVE